MKRFIAVFEISPLENAPWVASACKAAGVELLDNDPITEVMAKDPEARKAILSSQQVPWGINEGLIPFYRKALETLAGPRTSIALVGSNWLAYAEEPGVCILDFDPLEAEGQRGIQQGVAPADAANYVKTFTDELTQRAKKYLPADRSLVLPKGAPDAQKAELAAAFIRKLAR
jgi:hypothetical protein